MALLIELLRPEDLLALVIEAINLRVDVTTAGDPKLVREVPANAAYLIVHFPPQSIAEQAFFEVDPHIQTNPKAGVLPPAAPGLPATADPLLPPGQVGARMASPSRLVFRLPQTVASIPFEMASLLDWSGLELIVSPIARGKVLPAPLVAPTALQTSLEIPWRLALSPSSNVTWNHATDPVTYRGRTELWHTRLASLHSEVEGTDTVLVPLEASEQDPVPLRALWTPGFRDHLALPDHNTDSRPFLSAMSERDRSQIVILTSGVSGYLEQATPGTPPTPWVPQPVQASRLFLSSLGGWLDSRGAWEPQPFYRIPGLRTVELPTQALDLAEWVHQAAQGRDQYVRIVYDGFLYPFGHRASLIKVTERKFVPADGGLPVAYMMQHMYIVVREREKTYPPGTFANQGREMPLWQKVTVETKVTPSIDPPAYLSGGTLDSFWVQVDKEDFQFHLSAIDLAGAKVNFLASVIFFGMGETQPDFIRTEYAGSGERRACSVAGQKVAYAAPSAGDTIHATTNLYFDTQSVSPGHPGSGPPYPVAPFQPLLHQADVHVSSLDILLGTTTPVTIAFYQPYLAHDLDGQAGVFATITSAVPQIAFTAEKSGGLSTPALSVQGLSARKGVTSGSLDDAAAGVINPDMFFTDGAMLFGTVPIKKLIKTSGSTADAGPNAPEISTKLKPNNKNPSKSVTKIQWAPELQDYPGPPVEVTFGPTAALTLEAVITRDLQGGPPVTVVNGELTDFTLLILDVVQLQIISLAFASKDGEKTKVKAQLPESQAIAFQAALSFVQTLAEILPKGIFSAGLSVKLDPDKIVVSLTIGLPPLSIGVFSLENITVMTGLDLPYIDGKPGFEFAFAKRSSPFLLTIECLGGGGFVHLIVTADGVQMVEGALEFGGEFSLNLGVASGGVHILAGIYFQVTNKSTTVSGFVDIGGEVSVLGIISVSIDLNLSLSFTVAGGKKTIQGKATLTISVHVIFFSVSVQLSVERSFSSGNGDPRVEQLIDAPQWATYAAAFA